MEVNVTTNALDGWSCPNAMFSNGRSYYCPGMGYGADVASHEWGHGYSDTGKLLVVFNEFFKSNESRQWSGHLVSCINIKAVR